MLVATLTVNSSSVPDDGSNQPPSSTDNKLPSKPNGQVSKDSKKPEILHIEAKNDKDLTTPVQEIAKPHRLSKRFISPHWGYELKRSSVNREKIWSESDDRLTGPGNPYGDANSPYKQEVLDLLIGLSKPKRHFGLLPAKEPRRKDLPPRLGEESAPRFARAFSLPAPANEKRPPSVRMTLSDLLRKAADFQPNVQQPIDYTGRRYWGQTFHIDTPININNLDVEFGTDTDYSYADSDYSESDLSDYSEVTYDLQEEDQDGNNSSVSTIKKEELDNFKKNLTKLMSMLRDLARV